MAIQNDHNIEPVNCVTRRQFLIFTMQLMAWASLTGCRKDSPVLGLSGIPNPYVVEDHSRFLARWAELGLRDAVLINLDTHDDFHFIPEEQIKSLQDIYNSGDWQGFSKADSLTNANLGLYDIGTWIYAGSRLGVFKEIYWVIPYPYFARGDAVRLLPMFLESRGFSADDISTFTLHDNQFSGTIRGMSVTICGLESLPVINKPILLSVDVDFFPTYIEEYKSSYLSALHTTFTTLHARKYRIMDAGVCYSVNGGYLLPHHRWVGDTVRMILDNPALLDQALPELLDIQQQVDNEYRSADAIKIFALTKEYLVRNRNSSLLLYNAFAFMLQGNQDKAYDTAMECCRIDKRYATAMPYIATLYYLKGQYKIAERFFRGGYNIDPTMRNGFFHFGNCLEKNGKLREALEVYQKEVERNGSFPTHFLMVSTYLKLGDRKSASSTLQVAVKNLQLYNFAKVDSRTVADAMYTVLDYCNKSGFKDLGDTLRRETAVVKMFEDFPYH